MASVPGEVVIKTRAIVLHRFPYSDSSFIVKALTEESGIVSFIVKGGKKKESPFRGALDPLALSEAVFRQNPNSELQFIKEATLLDFLRYAPQGVPLQEEFERLEQAISEFDSVSPQDSPVPEGNAHSSTQNDPDKSRIFAEWLLDTCDMWGYNLDLTTCSRCGRTLEKPAADFFPETGGFVCQACLGVEHPRARLETLIGLWALQTGDKIEHPEFTENALLTYLRHHIGFLKEIHSIKFLNETRKLFGHH